VCVRACVRACVCVCATLTMLSNNLNSYFVNTMKVDTLLKYCIAKVNIHCFAGMGQYTVHMVVNKVLKVFIF